jgi:hypothetical protein
MARNRIIYQSESVAVSIDHAAGAETTVAKGVQSVSYGLDVTREDVLQFGDLGAVDRIVLEAPVANVETSMYVGGLAPIILGDLLGAALSGRKVDCAVGLDNQEGQDYTSSDATVKLTSGSLTSMSAEGSVGSIPTITLGFEGTDLIFDGSAVGTPATDIDISTQSGVVVDFSELTGSFTGHYVHPQSATVSFDLGVEGLQELTYKLPAAAGGIVTASNKFQYARVPSFPATASLELEAFAVDRGMSMTLASVQQKASVDGQVGKANQGGFCNVAVNFGGTEFKLKSGTLDACSFSSSIGDTAATCNATFSCSIGGTGSVSTLLISEKPAGS